MHGTSEVVPPSKVLHMRALPPGCNSDDIVAFMRQFGTVAYVVMLPKRGQALVEMESLGSSQAVMTFAETNEVQIGGKQCYVNFSRSQAINRSAAQRVGITTTTAGVPVRTQSLQHRGENVLLCTINNAIYHVTPEVMHTIMSPYGAVNRIVIFTKRGVQALVEFADPASAARAQAQLDGKEIYDGCCQLKIIFSRNEKLTVTVNNERTFDYTNSSLPSYPHPEGPAGGQGWNRPSYSARGQYQAPSAGGGYGASSGFAGRSYGATPGRGYGAGGAGAGAYGAGSAPRYGGDVAYGSHPAAAEGCVVIVYNFPLSLGISGLFNLFGLYGNIMKIRTLPKSGAALIQFEARVQANGAISYLNGCELHGQKLSVQYSKHPYVTDSPSEDDAGGETQDFSSSMLNRFKRAEHFRHIYRPSTVVHFANCPPSFDESALKHHFSSRGATAPEAIKFFAPRPGSDPSRARKIGLCEWPSAERATEALVAGNNVEVDGFTVRLAFSENRL